ncbi:MAG: M20/M25/M40 family metallo-hydrolase, partial [Gemmatimonadales bacterium]
PGLLLAQSPASIQNAVNSITPEDIRRRVGLLADDSMLGRATPSPQLEQAARYIAGEFRRLGLKPGGDSGSYLQRFWILQRQLDSARATLEIAAPSGTVTLKPGRDVNLLPFGTLPSREISGPVVLLAGRGDTLRPLAGADVRGAWVAVFGSADPTGMRILDPAPQAAVRAGALGVLVISNRPDTMWQSRMARLFRSTLTPAWRVDADTVRHPAYLEIRDAQAARSLGVDVVALRALTSRTTQQLAGVVMTYRPAYRDVDRLSAPNVIGVLEGGDPQLRSEYVFFTGHMDHVGTPGAGQGCTARGGDSICNGADDDASGTTAVIEAAEAFARLSPRPKRSLVFMAVSGEERGLWGSEYFSEYPTVPLANTVANLNTDMVGRNWKDTIAVIGKEHSDLGRTLNRVAAAHPELRMQPIDDIWPQENFYFRSDHYNFARKGVPILFFFNGTHGDYHQVTDSPDKIDAEKQARIVKLVFYLGLDIANAPQRPQWNPDSYRRIVQGN